MYNLEVAQDHTFTVGAGQWVVHNHCGPGGNGEGFRSQRLLDRHFNDHNSEFHPPFANADAYEQGALDIMTQPSSTSPTLHEGISLRFDGTTDTIRVDTATGQYGVMGQDGVIRSFYIPDPAGNGGFTPVDWFLNHIDDLTF